MVSMYVSGQLSHYLASCRVTGCRSQRGQFDCRPCQLACQDVSQPATARLDRRLRRSMRCCRFRHGRAAGRCPHGSRIRRGRGCTGKRSVARRAVKSEEDLDEIMERANTALQRARQALSSSSNDSSGTAAPAFIPTSLTFGAPLPRQSEEEDETETDDDAIASPFARGPKAERSDAAVSSNGAGQDSATRTTSNAEHVRTSASSSAATRQSEASTQQSPRQGARLTSAGSPTSSNASASSASQPSSSLPGQMPEPPTGWSNDGKTSAPTLQLQRQRVTRSPSLDFAEAEPTQELTLPSQVLSLSF